MGRVQVVVIGIIRKGNTFLMTKRQDRESRFNGKWQLPGGGLEVEETIPECLKRELVEETNIEIGSYTFVPRVEEDIRDNWHGVFFNFLCTMKDEDQEVKVNSEASAYGWFTLEEIRKLDIIPHTYEIIEDAARLG
jgi:mutator protein MutT